MLYPVTQCHLVDGLDEIERSIIQSEMNQRQRIEKLERTGKDSALSRSLLAVFEDSLNLHYLYRLRIHQNGGTGHR